MAQWILRTSDYHYPDLAWFIQISISIISSIVLDNKTQHHGLVAVVVVAGTPFLASSSRFRRRYSCSFLETNTNSCSCLSKRFSCWDFSRGANLAGATISGLVSVVSAFTAHPETLNSAVTAGLVSCCLAPSHPPFPFTLTTGYEIFAAIFRYSYYSLSCCAVFSSVTKLFLTELVNWGGLMGITPIWGVICMLCMLSPGL